MSGILVVAEHEGGAFKKTRSMLAFPHRPQLEVA